MSDLRQTLHEMGEGLEPDSSLSVPVRTRVRHRQAVTAFVAAIKDAMALISDDPKQAAAIYLKAEKTKLGPDLIGAALADRSNLRFTLAPEHTNQIVDFMARTGSIKVKPAGWKDFFFPEIHGESGS